MRSVRRCIHSASLEEDRRPDVREHHRSVQLWETKRGYQLKGLLVVALRPSR